MKQAAAIALLGAAVAASVAAAAAFRRDSGAAPPTAVVTRTTFVDFLQLRGEIRPVRSVVLTAPSAGSDLQIVELAANGSKVAAGDEKWFLVLALAMPVVALLLLIESIRAHNTFGWVLFALWIGASLINFLQWRRRKRMRLVQGQVGTVVADHSACPDGRDHRR